MKFVPNASKKDHMLKIMGLSSVEELFSDIPKDIHIDGIDALPDGCSQQDIESMIKEIGKKNRSFEDMPSFLGGGIKPHYIPAAVKATIGRSEFYTAYTPYQPEISQGFLQAMFEFQSMMAIVTGMDVSNASLYDGDTSIGEAALMCHRATKNNTFLIPESMSEEKKKVLHCYVDGIGLKIVEIPFDTKSGRMDLSALKDLIDDDTCGVYVENPNYFGVFEEEVVNISAILKKHKALFVVGVDLISLGVVISPGEYGADIVVAEGSCFGSGMDFGGSSLGVLTCKKNLLRQMPGRIIGRTEDADGKRAFCMSLQTREQHIRRSRATSNICSNEGLCALAACAHLAWLGGTGLSELAKVNFDKAQRLKERMVKIKGYSLRFEGACFNEFMICCPDARKLHEYLLRNGIHGGSIVSDVGATECMLFGVTEMHTQKDCDRLIDLMKEAAL